MPDQIRAVQNKDPRQTVTPVSRLLNALTFGATRFPAESVFSPTSAATLMELLPPVGFADLATKDDLAHMATEIRSEMAVGFSQVDARFAQVDVRFAQVDARFAELNATLAGVETRILRDQRVFTFTLISSLTGLAAIALTIIGLS